MATLNLGRIKPVFRGAYAGGTAYVVDDIVTSGNETFICILASTGNATSNATYWTKLAAKGTDGTDLTSTLTTEGDILYRDGSGLQRLAKGTANQTLQMNAGATAPNWVTAASGQTVKISDQTVSTAVSSISFDGVFTTDYQIYKMYLMNVNMEGTSAGHLRARVRVSDADVTASGNYYASHSGTYRSSSTTEWNGGNWQDDHFNFGGWNIPDDNTNQHDTVNFELTLFDPLKTTASGRTLFAFQGGGWERADTYTYSAQGILLYNVASAISGMTFYQSAGSNFRDGTRLVVYGIKT